MCFAFQMCFKENGKITKNLKNILGIFIFLTAQLKRREWMSETIFTKIIKREIPADIVYEDDLCLAFRDINPRAPVHLLVIPKKPLATLADAGTDDQKMLGHLLVVANIVAEKEGVGDAFRLVLNNGAGAGQEVFHLHLHVLAGRSFTWPPG